jgi:hypothetical protein
VEVHLDAPLGDRAVISAYAESFGESALEVVRCGVERGRREACSRLG